MKIATVVKTLNEELNIARFCQGYDFVDAILVADGGSKDKTVSLAQQFDNVKVKTFPLKVEMPGDPMGFMNPEPQHLNFCIDWAIEEKADWIILDGCDCWPNPLLQREARSILTDAAEPIVMITRLYIWGKDEVFINMGKGGGLWAWRPADVEIRSEEPEGALTCFNAQMTGIVGPQKRLPPLYCCLHYFCPDEETVQMKLERYAAWGYPQIHPLLAFGPRVKIPEVVFQ